MAIETLLLGESAGELIRKTNSNFEQVVASTGGKQYNLSTVLNHGEAIKLDETDSAAFATILQDFTKLFDFQNVGVILSGETDEGHQPFVNLNITTSADGNTITFSYQSLFADLEITADMTTGILTGLIKNKRSSSTQNIFSGTREEYDVAYASGLIPNGMFVIITDEDDVDAGTSSILGQGILGQMILG